MSTLGCTSAVLRSSVVAKGRPGTVLRGMERFGVAASWLRALPVLPPAFERRFIAFPWPGRGIVAGQTSVPEVASSRCRKSGHFNVEMGQERHFRDVRGESSPMEG
jgi:hypothetical protein